jgi:signal transduction histidine kinase
MALTPLAPDVRHDPFFSFFMVAAVASTWIGGRGPGLFAIGLSIVGADLLLPRGSFLLHDRDDLIRFLLFSSASTVMVLLIAALQSVHRRQKQTEETLHRTEKLLAVGQLASSMAHEINNPLTSVTNLLFLMQGRTVNDPEAAGYVAVAQRELARVVHIANQTLGLYRESSPPAVLNVAELLEDILEVYRDRLAGPQLNIDKRYDSAGNLRACRGDLRQLFSNLLLNAIEATEPGGTIRLRVRSCHTLPPEMRHGVQITFADSGHGIPPSFRDRIFEPFFTTKTEKGTGLGLWVVREIVERYGGSIRIRSRTGSRPTGTVVAVFLPGETEGRTQGALPLEPAGRR